MKTFKFTKDGKTHTVEAEHSVAAVLKANEHFNPFDSDKPGEWRETDPGVSREHNWHYNNGRCLFFQRGKWVLFDKSVPVKDQPVS